MPLGYGQVDTYGSLQYKQDLEASFLTQNKINAQTGVCIGFAAKKTQGQGYQFLRNRAVPEAWIWPDPQSDPLEVVDQRNNLRYLVLDEVTGHFYEIGTRKGPANSGISEAWEDKASDGYAGIEIPCGLQLRDHIGRAEHETIDHVETHAYLRPRHRENKGAAGYTADGFRPAQEFEIRGYKDGNVAENMRTKDVPLNGDFVFDRGVADSKRFQIGLFTSASDFRITGMDTYYLLIDESETQKAMSEHGWQREFAAQGIWLTRGPNPLINRATGAAVGGGFFSMVTGPDNKETSAMYFSGQEGLILGDISISGDFTFIFSLSGLELPCQLCGFIEIFEENNVRYIRLSHEGQTVTQILSWTTGWVTLMVKRSEGDIIIGEGGSIIGTHVNRFPNSMVWNMNLMVNQIGNLFNFWLLDPAISNAAFEYYYLDLTENEGDALLPLW